MDMFSSLCARSEELCSRLASVYWKGCKRLWNALQPSVPSRGSSGTTRLRHLCARLHAFSVICVQLRQHRMRPQSRFEIWGLFARVVNEPSSKCISAQLFMNRSSFSRSLYLCCLLVGVMLAVSGCLTFFCAITFTIWKSHLGGNPSIYWTTGISGVIMGTFAIAMWDIGSRQLRIEEHQLAILQRLDKCAKPMDPGIPAPPQL
jgi:hypothetical protein